MTDDITYTSTSPAGVPNSTKQATDEHVTRGHMPIVKIGYSADGSATLGQVDADGVLVNLGSNNDVTVTGSVTANAGTNLNTSALATEATLDARTGALTETAPTTDTASSGLNGRLQRIAQRITSLIALIPASLGQKTKANSLAVTLASDQDALPVTDNSGSLTVDNAGTFAVQVDGSALTALQLIDNIVQTEDAAHSSGDTGVMMLGIRDDTLSVFSGAENDYEPLHLTAAGRLYTSATVDTALPAGTNNIGDVDVLTLPGSLTGYAEDAAHNSGDVGVQALAVRKDTGATIAGTDGDYSPLQVDSSGNLRVNVVTGGGTGGTATTDDGAFTAGSGSGTPMMGFVTADSVDSGDVGVVGMLANRQLKVTLYDSAGVELAVGGGTQYTEDAAAAANPVGNALMLVREDARAGTLVSADGDNVAARGNNKGELYVKTTDSDALLTTIAGAVSGTEMQVDVVAALPAGTNAIGKLAANSGVDIGDVDVISVIPGTGATNLGKAIDTATGATDTGVLVLATRDDALGALTPIEGDNVQLRTDANGALWTHDDALDAALSGSELQVDVVAALPAGTNNIGDVDVLSIAAGDNNIGNVDIVTVPAPLSTTGTGTEATALRVTIATDSTGVLSVDDNGGALTVDGTVTANLAAGTNNIGDVDILSIAAGDNNIGNVDIVSGTITTVSALGNSTTGPQKAEDVASADADVGIPAMAVRKGTPANTSGTDGDYEFLQMSAGRLWASATIDAALPAGTNAIGKLAANSGVDIGDVDVTSVTPGTTATALGKAEDAGHTSGDAGVFSLGVRNDTPNTATSNADADYSQLSTDKVGGIRTALYETDFAVLGTNHVKKYYTNAGAVTDGIVWSPAAGKRWYVTDIFINVSAAATVTLEDDLVGGDSAVWKAELAANSGWSHSFQTPLFSGEDAADLLVTTSAANVYIMVTGYEI